MFYFCTFETTQTQIPNSDNVYTKLSYQYVLESEKPNPHN